MFCAKTLVVNKMLTYSTKKDSYLTIKIGAKQQFSGGLVANYSTALQVTLFKGKGIVAVIRLQDWPLPILTSPSSHV